MKHPWWNLTVPIDSKLQSTDFISHKCYKNAWPQHIKEEWGVFSNQETGEGYSDILIETENSETAILIEVKYAGDGNLDVACERALKQVEERKYDEELRENGVDKILKYGIACYMKRCKVKLAEESYIET